MLHTTTVKPHTLALLRSLQSKNYIEQFVLVGGTALALQIGHRESIDLDMFTITDFDSNALLANLLNDYSVTPNLQTPQTLICEIEGVKVDFIRFKYPFNRPILRVEDVRMLAIEDIAPMKLDAITGRGSKKDFFDLYFLLKLFNLDTLLALYQEKYPHQTTFHVVRSLSYFVDAERYPDPLVFNKKVTWQTVKKAIAKAVQAL